jgi:hypothetical protein
MKIGFSFRDKELSIGRDFKNINLKYLWDPSTISLVLVNIITIFFAIIEKWSLVTLLIIYWNQSLIIGFFTIIRIIKLKRFTTNFYKINGVPAEIDSKTKFRVTKDFISMYGIIHLIYFYLIYSLDKSFLNNSLLHLNFLIIILESIVFFINHLYSFIHNSIKEKDKIKDLGDILAVPYLRILPMHIVLFIGSLIIAITSNSIYTLSLFLILKTFMDVLTHIGEHN